jgi:DNA-binding NarL/FixJ family response regulator
MSDAERLPARAEASITVLVADDQALVRAGFRSILEAQPGIAVVGEAGDGRDAVDLARRRRPDVVLMDIQMPDLDGLEATRRIVEEADEENPVAVLMLTTFDLNEYVYEALRAGASGFLLKDVMPEDLIAAVRVVAAGDGLIAPTITKRLIEQFARTRSAHCPAAGPGRAHATRAGGADACGPRTDQQRNRRRARPQPGDGQDPRQADPEQAGRA